MKLGVLSLSTALVLSAAAAIARPNESCPPAKCDTSETASAIWDALPIEARGNTWGDEIYFSIPVDVKAEKDARDVVSVGELGYWPPGTAFCIFWVTITKTIATPTRWSRRKHEF